MSRRTKKRKKPIATKTRATIRMVALHTAIDAGQPLPPPRWAWEFYITDHLMARSGANYSRRRQAERAWRRFRDRVVRKHYVLHRTPPGLPAKEGSRE